MPNCSAAPICGRESPGRRFCAADYHWFTQTCSRIGISSRDTAAQWNILAKITAITGAPPCAVTDEHFDTARVAMTLAYTRRGKPTAGKNVAAVFHRLRLTLFHAGRLSTLRRPVSHPPVAVTGWATVAPGFAESAHRYVEQVTVSLRASTVKAIEHDLREFGTWLADTHPEVGSCADLHREHIEAFKTWLCTHPTPRTGAPLNRVSIKNALINLHCFFTRITEWGYPNPPVRPLLFPGDLPIIDKPLPRFLDDAAAAKLLRATRADPDPLSRLIVELLARTGIRRGELLALTADAVVQIGSAYWLRIPIGKLHNDRYIPLHPQLKQLLDDWITHHRPTGLRTNRLLLEHNRPISQQRVTKALRYAADTAGIGNVTAHQLRHTLATQAVNRGMSLDAIAALLGHKTLAMTNDLRPHRRQDRRRRILRRHREGRSTLRSAPPSWPATTKATRCANSAPRCTAACSATATAPDQSRWTATSNPSANPAASSSPPSSSGPPCNGNATTPPARANSAARRSSTASSTDSTPTSPFVLPAATGPHHAWWAPAMTSRSERLHSSVS